MSYIRQESTGRIFTLCDVEKMSSFFSLTFGQNVRAFQYVCQELQSEVVEHRLLSIQTPLIPMSTALVSSFLDLPADIII